MRRFFLLLFLLPLNLYAQGAGTPPYRGLNNWSLIFGTDNVFDIGAVSSQRPRTGYFGTSVITPSLTVSGLTPGRVPFASTGGLLADDADLTFATDTLTATRVMVGAGTAGSPSIGWSADDDGSGTGFHRNSANNIAVDIAGTLRWYWSGTDFNPNSNNSQSIGGSTTNLFRIFVGNAVEGATTKTLTDNTIASFMRVACAAGDMAAGTVDYVAFAENGTTESQSMVGTMQWSCLNLTGTEVCPTPTNQGTPLHNETTGGTADLTVTWACDTSPTNAVDLRVTVDTGIAAPTAVELRYRMNVVSGSPLLTAQ